VDCTSIQGRFIPRRPERLAGRCHCSPQPKVRTHFRRRAPGIESHASTRWQRGLIVLDRITPMDQSRLCRRDSVAYLGNFQIRFARLPPAFALERWNPRTSLSTRFRRLPSELLDEISSVALRISTGETQSSVGTPGHLCRRDSLACRRNFQTRLPGLPPKLCRRDSLACFQNLWTIFPLLPSESLDAIPSPAFRTPAGDADSSIRTKDILVERIASGRVVVIWQTRRVRREKHERKIER